MELVLFEMKTEVINLLQPTNISQKPSSAFYIKNNILWQQIL